MRRHGWAFCLGAILTGAAVAQPPADEERFPPAPDLPGTVVGQLPGPSPRLIDPGKDVPKDVPKTEAKIAPKDARQIPPGEVEIVPKSGTPVTPVIPVEPAPAMGMFPSTNAGCPPARTGCHIGCADIKEWLCFHSKARQTGHYVMPYRPPLQAWFSCEPRPLAPVAAPACANAAMTSGPVAPAPLATGLPDGEAVPIESEPPAPPLGGGVPIGKCLESEVLTNFQPVNPGLLFTQGAAPTSNPTTQVKPTSFKPK